MSLPSVLAKMASRVRTLKGTIPAVSQQTAGLRQAARPHKTLRKLGILIWAQQHPLWGHWCQTLKLQKLKGQQHAEAGSLCHKFSASCSPPLAHLFHHQVNLAKGACSERIKGEHICPFLARSLEVSRVHEARIQPGRYWGRKWDLTSHILWNCPQTLGRPGKTDHTQGN